MTASFFLADAEKYVLDYFQNCAKSPARIVTSAMVEHDGVPMAVVTFYNPESDRVETFDVWRETTGQLYGEY